MDEVEFLNEYEKQKEYLLEWSNKIKEVLISELSKQGYMLEKNIKIPMEPRLKDNSSIIQKAFYRKKNYTNPLVEITDKVGIRIVVLILSEIEIIKKAIESISIWNFSKDKDFEEDKENHPTIFDYQSVHYILKNKEQITSNDIIIPKDTPCEIQIRTLLQHAYSELTHDTTYKPTKVLDKKIYRLISRSMAMIETTDNIFEEVDSMVNKDTIQLKMKDTIYPLLLEMYSEINTPENNKVINDIIVDEYKEEINQLNIQELTNFIKNPKQFTMLKSQINRRYDYILLFRDPIILLIYYFVNKLPDIIKNKWPFTDDIIKPIYIGLGISYD